MKKHICTLVFILSALFAWAQNTVPNGGFESWSGGQPANWTTKLSGNVMVSIPYIGDFPYPMNMNFGTQVSDAHSGSHALKLMSSTSSIPTTENIYTIPGVAQLGETGEFSIPLSTITGILSDGLSSLDWDDLGDLATLLNLVSPGMPCESTPYDLTLWVKYLPQSGDTMRVVAYTKKNRIPVSYATFETNQSMPDYTQIRVTFNNPYAECDSVCIIIFSGGMSTDPGTELYVDDVEFDYHVGVAEQSSLKVNVYPNPATGQFRVEPACGDPYQYRLTDLTGRRVASGHQSGAADVDVRALAPGVYMLFIEQKDHTLTRKVVVR